MVSIIKKFSRTKITRKEFLVYIGSVFLGIIGIPSLLELISNIKPSSKTKPRTFGSGAYGGTVSKRAPKLAS